MDSSFNLKNPKSKAVKLEAVLMNSMKSLPCCAISFSVISSRRMAASHMLLAESYTNPTVAPLTPNMRPKTDSLNKPQLDPINNERDGKPDLWLRGPPHNKEFRLTMGPSICKCCSQYGGPPPYISSKYQNPSSHVLCFWLLDTNMLCTQMCSCSIRYGYVGAVSVIFWHREPYREDFGSDNSTTV